MLLLSLSDGEHFILSWEGRWVCEIYRKTKKILMQPINRPVGRGGPHNMMLWLQIGFLSFYINL
jgi:hypothetical protein